MALHQSCLMPHTVASVGIIKRIDKQSELESVTFSQLSGWNEPKKRQSVILDLFKSCLR
jgi:hypothetical protein